jgi:hypothetical protein
MEGGVYFAKDFAKDTEPVKIQIKVAKMAQATLCRKPHPCGISAPFLEHP